MRIFRRKKKVLSPEEAAKQVGRETADALVDTIRNLTAYMGGMAERMSEITKEQRQEAEAGEQAEEESINKAQEVLNDEHPGL